MAIDRVPPLAALFAAVQSRAAQESDSASAEISSPESARSQQGRMRHDIGALRQQLVSVARDVDMSSSDSVAAAQSRIIRSVLLWEYGSDVREHLQWRQMLEKISYDIEANDQLREAFRQLLMELGAKSGNRL